ncbi:MAG: phosphoglycerate dehydrogenase [Alphaproteobacteria bacterium]|nr:phosphoglycerate dehydrogenase [Alphaproteobacteria bacterium]
MNSSPLVAVASRSFSLHAVLVPELRAKFPNLRLNEAGKSLAGDELVEHLQGAERAVIALEKIDASILSRLPDLKIIGKYGVGLDNIDMAAMREHGVKLGWTGGVNRLGVAELALELMLGGLRKTWESRELAENGGWVQIRGRQLSGKTVGIIGFGHVGKEVARILAPFQVRILVNDIKDVSEAAAAAGAALAEKDQIFAEADVITLHTPKTADTTRMIDARALSMMKPDAVVVNTARGGLIDEPALYAALTENRIGAAAMDVFESEPPGDNPLIKLTNFAATTHIGGSSEEAVLNMGRAAIAGLENAVEALEENFFS